MALDNIFKRVKKAGKALALLSDDQQNEILNRVADAIIEGMPALLKANQHDLARMDHEDPMYDQLQLTEARLTEIADGMRQVATLPSPLGHVLKHQVLDNGLDLKRVSVPFGVIGVIYEARPNVTFDVFALCLKSGNACVLKCGRDAIDSCQAGVDLIHRVLTQMNIAPDILALLPPAHETTAEMLQAVGYIDLCIPRGSQRLINFVRDTAKVPVIETGAGVVHCYFDSEGDLGIAPAIIDNAKTRRPSVCNTLDCLIIHADARAHHVLKRHYPTQLLTPVANDDEYNTEWLSLQMGIKTVDNLDEALLHIDTYGSGHSESIITDNADHAWRFQAMVDAACVYVNTPTSFTDGAQFGMGAEIGISTQKLGARGPMALEEMITYKWLIEGRGQVR